MALILASGSPRRRELMSLITPDYTVITSDVDETKIAADSPAHLAKALATAKARAVAEENPDRGRMRGRFTVAARKRVIAARLALISQRTGPPTASVSVPSAAYGGCTPTRACGRSPAGEAFYSPSTASITRSQSSKDRFVEQGRLTMYLR